MIAVLVQIPLPEPLTLDAARARFTSTAPKYQGVAGLLRKVYLLAGDGRTSGALYLWESRAAAERFFDADWYAFIEEKYGAPPSLTFFDAPVEVDNVAGAIHTR